MSTTAAIASANPQQSVANSTTTTTTTTTTKSTTGEAPQQQPSLDAATKKESNFKQQQQQATENNQHQHQSDASNAKTNTKATKHTPAGGNAPSSATQQQQHSSTAATSSYSKINSQSHVNGATTTTNTTNATTTTTTNNNNSATLQQSTQATKNTTKSNFNAWSGSYNAVLKNESSSAEQHQQTTNNNNSQRNAASRNAAAAATSTTTTTTAPAQSAVAAQSLTATATTASKKSGSQKANSQSSLGFLKASSLQSSDKSKKQSANVGNETSNVALTTMTTTTTAARASEPNSKVDSSSAIKSSLEQQQQQLHQRSAKHQVTNDRSQDSTNSKRTISFNASEDGAPSSVISNFRAGNRNNSSGGGNTSFNNNHSRNSNRHHHHNHNHHNNNDDYHNFESLSKTNLYIRGLDSNTTDNDLYALCSKFGKITSTKAILDKSTGKCKGYGFVDFETPAAAANAVTDLIKRGVLVNMAKQQEADPTNLYLANLPLMMTDTELESLLLPFGPVVSTRILFNQSNKQARGVGFARMSSKEQCDEIIAQLNGQLLKGSNEPLLIKFADGAKRQKHSPYPNSHAYPYRSSGGGSMMGDWRSNNNDANHHSANQATGNRSFRSSADHMRQNNSIQNSNNGASKHSHGMSSIPNYHGHHPTATHSHQNLNSHLAQSQEHQGHHQHDLTSHTNPSNIRAQNSNTYPGFPIPGSMGAGGDASQWIHPSQAGQPYVIPQMLHPSSLHYMNLATQMQGMQLNPSVAGYISTQQWPMWPNVNAKQHSANPNQAQNQMGNGNNQSGYTETD